MIMTKLLQMTVMQHTECSCSRDAMFHHYRNDYHEIQWSDVSASSSCNIDTIVTIITIIMMIIITTIMTIIIIIIIL